MYGLLHMLTSMHAQHRARALTNLRTRAHPNTRRHTNTHTHTHTHTHAHTYTDAQGFRAGCHCLPGPEPAAAVHIHAGAFGRALCVRLQRQVRTHTHTHSLAHKYTHSLTHTLTLTHELTHSVTHSLTHSLSYTHTHTHTHTHTPTQTRKVFEQVVTAYLGQNPQQRYTSTLVHLAGPFVYVYRDRPADIFFMLQALAEMLGVWFLTPTHALSPSSLDLSHARNSCPLQVYKP